MISNQKLEKIKEVEFTRPAWNDRPRSVLIWEGKKAQDIVKASGLVSGEECEWEELSIQYGQLFIKYVDGSSDVFASIGDSYWQSGWTK